MTTVLVTGCLGFIGSHFVKYILKNTHYNVIGFNRNTDQINFHRLYEIWNYVDPNKVNKPDILRNPLLTDRFKLIFGDLSDNNSVSGLAEDVDYIVNFAAKTFVDHSIRDAQPFIRSNIVGTFNLLEEARRNYQTNHTLKRYIQVSTDEVYGSILEGAYKEDSRLNPTNPYSATKAAADMLCVSYFNTYQLPIIITRTENNFGEYQHPQKALPKFVKYALENRKLPVYGDGEHRRMWLYVLDHCSAIHHLLTHSKVSEIYHIAGEQELTNNQLANKILNIMGKENKDGNMIEYINDHNIRPGHDRRYALNTQKLKATGWEPKYKLDETLTNVVEWYKDNRWWLR